jgi:hypothetical protein
MSNARPAWTSRNRIVRLARRAVLKTATLHWGTKSFECWVLLCAVLSRVRPRGVVELGSGRSTSYLAEYAVKANVPFASIEQNWFYAIKIRRGLRNSLLPARFVHHVPLAPDGWYDGARLHRIVDFACDCLFVDGPVGVDEDLGNGRRAGARAQAWLRQAAATSRVIIVDDVHRRANLELLQQLVATAPDRAPLFMRYHVQPVPNVLAIAVPRPELAALTGVCAALRLPIATEYSAAECSEA